MIQHQHGIIQQKYWKRNINVLEGGCCIKYLFVCMSGYMLKLKTFLFLMQTFKQNIKRSPPSLSLHKIHLVNEAYKVRFVCVCVSLSVACLNSMP